VELIHDEYYDNLESFFLIKNDYWLRIKTIDGKTQCLELKMPSNVLLPTGQQNLNKYIELINAEDMAKALLELAKHSIEILKPILEKLTSIKSITDFFKLEQIATLSSKRTSFTLENGVKIDLDQTDFGYFCGEIEILIDENSDHADINMAYHLIDETVTNLGKIRLFSGITCGSYLI
jgi:hypothetical protein